MQLQKVNTAVLPLSVPSFVGYNYEIWNLIALPMAQTDTGTDRNVSLVAGWNLIGYTGNESIALDNAEFTNSSGSTSSLATAVASN